MAASGNPWRRTMALFAITSLVESLAFGHLGAFTPLYLEQLGIPRNRVPALTGVLSALPFVIGVPLLPLWGVWADRYGRRLVIVRSSVAAALIYALTASAESFWMVAFARMLGGFVFGNTGVMLAMQADNTPRERLGTAVAVIGAGGPVGMAVGPYAGGIIAHRWGIPALLWIDAALTMGIVVLLVALLREERVPAARDLATRAGVAEAFHPITRTPAVRQLFAAIFLAGSGVTLSSTFGPLLIQALYAGADIERTIGAVLTAGGAAMALGTPIWGGLGDRLGHLRILLVCAAATAVSIAGQAAAGGLWQLAVWRAAQGLFQGGTGALATVLLAGHSPEDRRSSILNLSLVPQQLAWFLAPLAGAAASRISIQASFWLGAALMAGGCALFLRLPPLPRRGEAAARA